MPGKSNTGCWEKDVDEGCIENRTNDYLGCIIYCTDICQWFSVRIARLKGAI